MKRLFVHMAFTCLAIHKLHAQDSVQLHETVILSDRFTNFSSSQILSHPDSLLTKSNNFRNLQDVLAEQSQVFIKNYGPGNIATASLRGTGAEHTALVWNGINLQSPVLGQVDFSVIPFSSSDQITIRLGGNGALYGSGAIGGAIHLDNKPNFNSPLKTEISFQAGQAERFNESAGITFGYKNSAFSFRFIQQNAENNFNYKNSFIAGNPSMTLKHARTSLTALFGNAWLLQKKSVTGIHMWLQNSDRLIPPGLSTVNTGAEQHDRSIRVSVEHTIFLHSNQLLFKTAYLEDHLNYTDSLRSLQSNSSSKSFIYEGEYKLKFNSLFTGNIGVNHTDNYAIGASYSSVRMSRTALFTSLEYKSLKGKINTGFSVRSELLDGKFVPVMPEIHGSFKLNKSLVIMGSISRSYRVPTFNEKYWNPGGNITLKPEFGYNAEVSLNHTLKLASMLVSGSFSYFGREISNWIMWVPIGSYWSPENILLVRTIGFEWRESISFTFNKNSSIKGNFALNAISSKTENLSTTYQLPYLPRITHQYALHYIYKTITLSYTHTYTGMRYLDNTNSTSLPSFQVANFRACTNLKMKKFNINLFAESTNLFNTQYTVIPDRVMPGRLFSLGINLNY